MAEDPQQETINLLNYRLNAVTVERDEWKAKFIKQNKDLGCEMMDPNGTIWDYAKKLQTELAAVTEQRDRLAEAMRNCLPFISSEGMGEYHDAREALAAVKGGSDES